MSTMTIDELLHEIDMFTVTPEFVEEMMARLAAANKEFEEKDRKSAITSEWLNRTYTI